MKLRWIMLVVIALAVAGCLVLLFRPDNGPQQAVAATRRALQAQGFKTELSEFDFSATQEMCARVAALTNAGFVRAAENGIEYPRRAALQEGKPELMKSVGPDAAIVVWKLEKLESHQGEDIWPLLRKVMDQSGSPLDAACQAALAGPIRFNLTASQGIHMLLPHLSALKQIEQALGNRAVLELRDGNRDAAWTNLLAATRTATAYAPDLAEVSHLVRFACAAIAAQVTWQVLQAGDWPDARLVRLQQEWMAVDFFHDLPETMAFTRAGVVQACRDERQQPVSRPTIMLRELFRSPRSVWQSFQYYRQRVQYRHHGTFEDEKALLLHYRDRELQLRQAVQLPTWSLMRQLPGVTNPPVFKSKHSSALQMQMNSRQMMLGMRSEGSGLLGRAAEAETRRRLVITAIALERFRGRHGSYPKALDDLVPNFLSTAAVDFMDGQPLRYRLTDDGHFVLYSVGLDCADNGGEMRRPSQRGVLADRGPDFAFPQDTDLVWPRPAAAAEVAAQLTAERRQVEFQKAEALKRSAEEEREAEVERQATVASLLARKSVPRRKEPTFEGRPLSQALRGKTDPGTPPLTLDELLTLKQIPTGDEPQMATFELPIPYNTLTNVGEPYLLVDVDPLDRSGGGDYEAVVWHPATNGNCRLIWDTIYAPPGQHALHLQLVCMEKKRGREVEVTGPMLPFYSSNLFQLDRMFGVFGTRAFFSAKLAETNGLYAIEITSPTGAHVKTFTGATSNGVVEVPWDLKDDQGNAYTNDSFNCDFKITLPDSGRSQTLRGP
jgi:hypothetical protein